MRMWMINPVILCDKHLRGEYVECLMFIGTFKRKLNIPGYVRNNLVEPLSIIDRFYELKNELIRREFNPTKNLDFDVCLLEYLKPEWLHAQVNVVNSLDDLIRRCDICCQKYEYLIDYNYIYKKDIEFTNQTYSRKEWENKKELNNV
jgi:hypothetical protein